MGAAKWSKQSISYLLALVPAHSWLDGDWGSLCCSSSSSEHEHTTRRQIKKRGEHSDFFFFFSVGEGPSCWSWIWTAPGYLLCGQFYVCCDLITSNLFLFNVITSALFSPTEGRGFTVMAQWEVQKWNGFVSGCFIYLENFVHTTFFNNTISNQNQRDRKRQTIVKYKENKEKEKRLSA